MTKDDKIPTGSKAVYKNLHQHLERGDDLILISRNDTESLLAELNLQQCIYVIQSESPPKTDANDLDSMESKISDELISMKEKT